MEKNLIYSELLDIYSALLTPKQVEAMEYYYYSDYSLGEISELMDISRQGVRDFIKRAEGIIDETEAKLHLVEKFRTAALISKDAEEIISENKRLSNIQSIDALARDILKKAAMIENGEK